MGLPMKEGKQSHRIVGVCTHERDFERQIIEN